MTDTDNLTIKTHAVHWSVEGPMFLTVHNLTETLYGELFDAADVIGERTAHSTAMPPRDLLSGFVVTDINQAAEAVTFCESLAENHRKIAKRLHDVIAKADKAGDPATTDPVTSSAAFHGKST